MLDAEGACLLVSFHPCPVQGNFLRLGQFARQPIFPDKGACLGVCLWKQLAIAEQIAKAGEFTVTKRDHLFVLQTTKCKLPSFRTSDRRLIVDYDDEWGWAGLGDGWPSFIRGNELHFMRADWFHLAIDAFGLSNKPEFFEDDVLLADITKRLAHRLMAEEIDPDPWPGMGFGWRDVAMWLAQGECLFVPFPKQPMI